MNRPLKFNLILIALLLTAILFSPASAVQPGDLYKQGDVVEFRIEKRGKVIGTQRAECMGMKEIDGDPLLFFAMKTTSIFEHSGRTLDMDVQCEAGYRPDGRPREYSFELKLLSSTVSQKGQFTETDYAGRSRRLGVEQPFSFAYQQWPILLDNNFALEWEIAMYGAPLQTGDSLLVNAMVPQLSQMIPLRITAMPPEQINFDGQNRSVRVLRIDPVNQLFYIDDSGRLLRAVDKANEISVTRMASGESAKIDRASLFAAIMTRIPGYSVLIGLAAIWFVIYVRREWRSPTIAAVLVAGVGLYLLAIQVLPAIQNAYFSFAINPRAEAFSIYLTLLGSAAIFALVELIAIAIPIAAGLTIRPPRSLRQAVAIGAACGVGFGLMQALNLTSFTADGSLQYKADLIHKFAAVGISTICGAMFGGIIATKQAAAFYLIPIGLKTLFNWEAVFLQKEVLTLPQHGVIAVLVAIIAALVLWLLNKRFGTVKFSVVLNRTK